MSAPLLPFTALRCGRRDKPRQRVTPEPLPARLLAHLRRLDEEQLQIIELVAAAVERGGM